MARYGAWQNESMVSAAEALDGSERQRQRGAFFGSIQGTLNHLLWGDRIWMHRFADTEKPRMTSISDSINETDHWDEYCVARSAMDATITDWAKRMDSNWLDGDLTWFSGAVNRDVSKTKQLLVIHFYNHGTHHRGQVHAMLSAAGQTQNDTDLPFLPD